MILDIAHDRPNPLFDPDGRCLYEVTDAATGEVIDEPIFYADDEMGVYRRHLLSPEWGYHSNPIYGNLPWEEVRRPIRIVPRLERLCASLRASLAEAGVAADDIPEPVLGALALFQERLERLERRVREYIANPLLAVTNPSPPADPLTEEEIRRITSASFPPVDSAEWLESVTSEEGPEDYWGH